MKLKFGVDLVECMRKGIDCSQKIVTIDVDPSTLSQEQRDLLAPRLKIDDNAFFVVPLVVLGAGTGQSCEIIGAVGTKIDDLIEACKNNQAQIQSSLPLTASAKNRGNHASLS